MKKYHIMVPAMLALSSALLLSACNNGAGSSAATTTSSNNLSGETSSSTTLYVASYCDFQTGFTPDNCTNNNVLGYTQSSDQFSSTNFSNSAVVPTSLAVLSGTLYTAGALYSGGPSGTAGVFQYSGSTNSWVNAGLTVNTYSLATYESNLYAGGTGAVYQYTNGSWSNIGKGSISSNIDIIALAADQSSGAIYASGATSSGSPSMYQYDDTSDSWFKIGTPLGDACRSYTLVVESSVLYATGCNAGGGGDGQVYSYQSGRWSIIGSNFGLVEAVSLVVYNNILYVGGYDNSSNSNAQVYAYNGQSWSATGLSGVSENNYSVAVTLAVSNGLLYAGGYYLDSSGYFGVLWVYNGDSWTLVDNNLSSSVISLTAG